MMSPFPWKLDEKEPDTIFDADGEIIAQNYRFLNLDDFEGLVEMVNLANKTTQSSHGTGNPENFIEAAKEKGRGYATTTESFEI